jgi:hypothetical protein
MRFSKRRADYLCGKESPIQQRFACGLAELSAGYRAACRLPHRRSRREALPPRGIRGLACEPTPKTAAIQSLFVTRYVGRSTRLARTIWLFGAIADDVERAAVAVDLLVAEPHMLVGVVQTSSCAGEMPSGIVSNEPTKMRNRGGFPTQRIFSGIEFNASRTCSASSPASLAPSLE